jgi:hypothetical protein
MELRLAALIEAIFVIMGTPDTTVLQCPLGLDKWLDLIVASRQRMLGLIVGAVLIKNYSSYRTKQKKVPRVLSPKP